MKNIFNWSVLIVFCCFIDLAWGFIGLLILLVYTILERKNSDLVRIIRDKVCSILDNPVVLMAVLGIFIWREVNTYVGFIVCVTSLILCFMEQKQVTFISNLRSDIINKPQYAAFAIWVLLLLLILHTFTSDIVSVIAVMAFILFLAHIFEFTILQSLIQSVVDFYHGIEKSVFFKNCGNNIVQFRVVYIGLFLVLLSMNARQMSLLDTTPATMLEYADGDGEYSSNIAVCEDCGKKFDTETDTYYNHKKGYEAHCSLTRCAKCEVQYWEEKDKEFWKESIKKARNKWVDDNPQEAKRRGIYKF